MKGFLGLFFTKRNSGNSTFRSNSPQSVTVPFLFRGFYKRKKTNVTREKNKHRERKRERAGKFDPTTIDSIRGPICGGVSLLINLSLI